VARGRDAIDVAITTTFGPNTLGRFKVWTDEVTSTWPGRRRHHNRDGTGRRAMERCVLDSPAKHIDLLPKLRLAKRRFALRRVRSRRAHGSVWL